jgi:3-oxoacyl-[acyl-carrier protein] reductase
MEPIQISDLKDKVILVTGASTGIGAAVARALGEQGARVAVHYNASAAPARDIVQAIEAAGGQAVAVQGDLAKRGAAEQVVQATVDRFGGLDGLVNNAGSMVRRCPIADLPDDLYDALMDLNVRSVVAASRAAIPHLRARGGGAIVNTTSVAARHGGGPGAVLYAASKGFVSTFTRGLAKEYVKDKIRVNAVAPGVIVTPFHDRYSTEAQLDAMRATIPMARLGTGDECVGAYLYLLSETLSSYVTGQVIEVNGGQLMP